MTQDCHIFSGHPSNYLSVCTWNRSFKEEKSNFKHKDLLRSVLLCLAQRNKVEFAVLHVLGNI